jgi:hypothetical protein
VLIVVIHHPYKYVLQHKPHAITHYNLSYSCYSAPGIHGFRVLRF